jgi:hypothetical protein
MLFRRLLLSLASLAVLWLAIELWFGSRAPEVRRSNDGAELLPTFEPSPEQLDRWRKRLTRLRKVASGEAAPKADPLILFSQHYGWTFAKGTRGTLAGTQVSFNGIGARGSREVGERPPFGVLRVACYGESFTFCFEVNDGDDWPTQLEAGADGGLEVLNLGVIGWGTDQALLRFRDSREQLGSDVVLIGLMSENIQRNVNRLVSVRAPDERLPLVKPRFLLEAGELRLLPQPYTSKLELYEAAVGGSLGYDLADHEWLAQSSAGSGWSRVVDALRIKRERAERGKWWLQWKQPQGEPFRVTVALLQAFHREALAGGARLAGVVVFPSMTDLADRDRKLTPLHAVLDQGGIPYVDLYDLIRARQERGEPTYGDAHLTAAANREVAGAVLEWLERELDL